MIWKTMNLIHSFVDKNLQVAARKHSTNHSSTPSTRSGTCESPSYFLLFIFSIFFKITLEIIRKSMNLIYSDLEKKPSRGCKEALDEPFQHI